MRIKHLGSLLYMVFISTLMLPLAWLSMNIWRKQRIKSEDFFGMSINLDKHPQETFQYVQELDIRHLLIRFNMADIDTIQDYVSWMRQFHNKTFLINVIQDPTLSKDQLDVAFRKIFTLFSPLAKQFQIGTTINRAKWGFYSVRQYLKFYQRAYKIAKKDFKEIELLGPSVIDFEYHYTTQALFNFFPVHFHASSALLYVDRTVTPENRQFGFDLLKKIDLLFSLVTLSPKSDNRLIITETNWPIENTGKYAPTSPLECVSEENFANYMVRYYLLALASSKVEAVYWHQLIAAGFGLIDPRGELRTRGAFYAFKTLLSQLQGAQEIFFDNRKDYYYLTYTNNGQKSSVLWTNDKPFTVNLSEDSDCLTRDGQSFRTKNLQLSGSPIYLLTSDIL